MQHSGKEMFLWNTFKILLCVLKVPELNIISGKLKFVRQMMMDALIIYSVLY